MCFITNVILLDQLKGCLVIVYFNATLFTSLSLHYYAVNVHYKIQQHRKCNITRTIIRVSNMCMYIKMYKGHLYGH